MLVAKDEPDSSSINQDNGNDNDSAPAFSLPQKRKRDALFDSSSVGLDPPSTTPKAPKVEPIMKVNHPKAVGAGHIEGFGNTVGEPNMDYDTPTGIAERNRGSRYSSGLNKTYNEIDKDLQKKGRNKGKAVKK